MAQTLKGNWHPCLARPSWPRPQWALSARSSYILPPRDYKWCGINSLLNLLSIFSGNHWVGFTGGGFCLGWWWGGGGQEKAEMTSCSQNSLGVGGAVAGNRARKNVPVGPHTYSHQYSQRETQRRKTGFQLTVVGSHYFRNLTSGRCTKKGAGISSQLVTASGNNMKISLDKWEWKKPPPYSGWSIKPFSDNSATHWKSDIS